MRRVLTDIAVVPYEFDAYPVEVAEQARVQRQVRADTLANLLLSDWQRPHQLIVQIDPQVRQHRDQGGRRRVVQVQCGIGSDAIMTQAELDLLGVAYAQHQLVPRAAQVAEAATGVPAGRHEVGSDLWLCSGASSDGPKQEGQQRPRIGSGVHDGDTRGL